MLMTVRDMLREETYWISIVHCPFSKPAPFTLYPISALNEAYARSTSTLHRGPSIRLLRDNLALENNRLRSRVVGNVGKDLAVPSWPAALSKASIDSQYKVACTWYGASSWKVSTS